MLLLLFLLPSIPPPAIAGPLTRASSEGRAEMALLVKTVRSGEGFSGEFAQKLDSPGAEVVSARGTLVYKAPRLMVLRYTEPPGQWLRFDGNRMTLFVPQNRQVLQKIIHKHQIPETPAILLASIPEISRWFFVREIESGKVNRGQKISIALIPRQMDPHLAQARLTLLKGEGILTGILFMEQNGAALSISLKNFRILQKIDRKDLAVTVPEGTTFVPVQGGF